ncbi:AraC family transcriptional regulator [Flexithrix dorotheae]|uniref:AraC family transcriptional regulator n=1 Tax=Flexithrix dorotheae TaxID=70993 RepID=UPI00037EF7AB|nr:AraC family transcriptional regulator [Flexithrix dorotheae]
MDPVLEKVTISSKHSFAVKEEILPYIKIGWHFHPEFELTLFTESTGRLFIGDYTDYFQPGDIFLIGPHLSHFMRNDPIFYQNDRNLRIRAVVIHFSENFLGDEFFHLPEMISIKKLLQSASRGIRISGKTREKIAPKIEKLLVQNGYHRIISLLNILQEISHAEKLEHLSSIGYQNTFNQEDAPRINAVFEFLLKNFLNDICLSDVADHVNMSNSAFCKFLKKRTGKTFSQILNELRIGYACRLFMEKGLTVSEVCFECGYNNLSYFNRKFKEITRFSPMEYRKEYRFSAVV